VNKSLGIKFGTDGWRAIMFTASHNPPQVKQVHLGLATDGDADRFGIIDADGEYLTANEVISLLIPYLITQRKLPGSVVRTVLSIYGHIPEKDGILACLLVAEVAATTGLPLGASLRKWAAQVGLAVTRRIDLVSNLDGVKYILENGSWLLIRASGTEPLVRIYLEAEHHNALRQLEHDVRALVATR
jgi:phosphoglucomutase